MFSITVLGIIGVAGLIVVKLISDDKYKSDYTQEDLIQIIKKLHGEKEALKDVRVAYAEKEYRDSLVNAKVASLEYKAKVNNQKASDLVNRVI